MYYTDNNIFKRPTCKIIQKYIDSYVNFVLFAIKRRENYV